MKELRVLVGDKVKLKRCADEPRGARGVVAGVAGPSLMVRLDDSGRVIHIPADQVTNFSLAARKAWRNMPARNVGRPRGSRVCDRLSVTIRVDRELWERFRLAEGTGIVMDRTATLNRWIADGLERLTAQTHRRAS